MSIADHPTWVQTIDDGVAAMHQAYAGRGWYSSHDLINWLIEHSEPVLKEIIESYRLKGDGAPVRDPYLIATRQIAKYLRDHRGQERIGRLKSYRKTIQTDPPRVGGYADATVWRIGTGSSSEQAVVPPNGSSSGGMPEAPEIPGGLLHDRGRGPEIRGTRITVYSLLPHLLDPTATEDFICQVNGLTPEQVAAARAYILRNPDTVLSEHLKIEERIAVGNSPQVIKRAEEARATFSKFKEWLSKRGKEGPTTPHSWATQEDAARHAGSFTTFREWLAEQKLKPERSS